MSHPLHHAFSFPGCLSVLLLSATAAAQYKTLPLDQFEAGAAEMIGQQVEVLGDLASFVPISPSASPTIVDPRMTLGRRALSDPEASRRLRELNAGGFVDPATLPQVYLDLSATPPATLQWFAENECRTSCESVYFRGEVVIHRVTRLPGLKLVEASYESTAAGVAQKGEAAAMLAEVEASGPAKELLPPGSIPNRQGFDAWIAKVPRGSAPSDASKSVWENMVAHSQAMQARNADSTRAILRGPDRPEDFQTYYRSIRDTALHRLFERHSYTDNSINWPRVALVIDEAPRGAAQMISEFMDGRTPQDMCWRLHGTVWTTPSGSVAIAPFNWCFSEMRFNVPYAQVPLWGTGMKSNMILVNQSTGSVRGDGPVPPAAPLPTDDARGGFSRQFSYNTAMVGNLLLDMGFDYHRPDGRVWINIGY